MRPPIAAIALFSLMARAGSARPTAASPPSSRAEKVVETLHGVKVADPYRWLENTGSPEVDAWTRAQDVYLRAHLDAAPGRAKIEERLWELHEVGSIGTPVATFPARGQRRTFFTRRDGKQNQPVLWLRDEPGTPKRALPDRVLLDVNAQAADGTLALDWWQPSDDGRWLAYGTSRDGSEESELRVRDAATGQDLADTIPRTRSASVAFLPDGTGFYYTRYPLPGSVPPAEEKYHRAVFFHHIGADPKADPRVFPPPDGPPRDMTDWPNLKLSPDGNTLAIEVSQGWTRSELFLLDPKNPAAAPIAVAAGTDALFGVAELTNTHLYVLSNDGAPRNQLFEVELARPARAHWRTLIAEGPDMLESVVIAPDRIVALHQHDATARVRVLSRSGKPNRAIKLPGLGTVAGLSGRPDDVTVYFHYSSFLDPGTVLALDSRTGKTRKFAELQTPFRRADFVVRQVRYPSKDGTLIPMFLVHRKGLASDGRRPTLLYGYGGFNISVTPGFAARLGPFLDAGGVYASANLRGGSEYGEDWHRAGMLAKKQNTFDDFIAAAQYLIAQKITSPAQLAISGRSNGGLLIGAAVTQRPELFRAAICGVPLLDMLRYHKFRIARLWIPEYGDPDKAEDFAWLRAYSPYHNVRPKTAYPATLIFTAVSDTRVDAMHARKMTAALQAATMSGHPILLRLEAQAGHGAGKPLGKQIAQFTDELGFLFAQLGLAP